jgi:hypothetical protein
MKQAWAGYGLLPLCLILLCTLGCFDPHGYQFMLPDSYIGWVRVDFGVDSAPEIFKGRKSLAEVRVGKDGRARTSQPMVVFAHDGEYKFLYETSKGPVPVPDELVSHEFLAGGITSRADDYEQQVKPSSWYFFIGPKSYRAQHPNSEFLKESAPLPLPGRLQTTPAL